EFLFSDHQDPPDQSLSIGDFLVTPGSVGSKPHCRERRFHRIGGAQVDPMICRKAIEGHHPLPVAVEGFDRVGAELMIAGRRTDRAALAPTFDSRCPLSMASNTLRPFRKAPTITGSAALVSSSPAFTYRPSAQAYTTSELSSFRLRQASYSSCHFARSRSIEEADSGAPSPSNLRKASSKSPWASPCR